MENFVPDCAGFWFVFNRKFGAVAMLFVVGPENALTYTEEGE